MEVIATNGVAKLGGDDFDLALRQIAQEAYEEANGEALEPREFTTGMAENEKKSLSRRSETRCRVLKMNLTLSRDEFLEAISPLVTQAEMLCEATVAEAGIDKSDIQGVFLVGGSTRIPYVRESVARVFGQEPTSTANVDEVVALGAALYAAYKGDHSNLSAVQKQSIQKIKVQETTAKCFGTISLASNSARDNPELQNTILIAKGEHIPCSVTEKFQTSADNQTRVALKVTESVARETDPRFVKTIWEGELELPSGRPAGQGIDITFAYDDNQVMRCSFVDVETAREINVDLSPARSNESSSAGVDQFLVE